MKKLNVGMIGAGFMGKAHSMAYASMPMFFWPAPAVPVRRTIADITLEAARDASERYGFEKYTDDWRTIINDPEIDIVDISTPNNLHAEIAIAAAEAGKHILCEKPLASTAADAKAMLDAVEKAGVVHMTAFNYRRTPAVLLAKKLLADGVLGKVLSYRGTYMCGGYDPSSPMDWRQRKSIAGYGILGDVGTHAIDIARYLVGDIAEVNGYLHNFVTMRPEKAGSDKLVPVENDDFTDFHVRFENGAIGSIEASRGAWGRNNQLTFELFAEKGSLKFNYERSDELDVFLADDPEDRRGYKTIYAGPQHPYGEYLWPVAALGIGYGEIKIIECHDFIKAVVDGVSPSPSFHDGYRAQLICDAVARSHETKTWESTGL